MLTKLIKVLAPKPTASVTRVVKPKPSLGFDTKSVKR